MRLFTEDPVAATFLLGCSPSPSFRVGVGQAAWKIGPSTQVILTMRDHQFWQDFQLSVHEKAALKRANEFHLPCLVRMLQAPIEIDVNPEAKGIK